MPQSISTSRQPIYCLDCGYVLNGVPDAGCPECGRSFSLRDPSSWTTYHKYVHKKVFDALIPGLLRGLGVINGIVCALAVVAAARALSSPGQMRSAPLWMVVIGVVCAGLCVACMMIATKRGERKALSPDLSQALGAISGIVSALAMVVPVCALSSPRPVPSVTLWMVVISVVCGGLCVACMMSSAKRGECDVLLPGLLRALGAVNGIVCALAVATVILASDRARADGSVLTAMSLLGVVGVGLSAACMMLAARRGERRAN